ncbi:MAG TPA: hypothetical protein VJ201_07490, partial [Candidatus Babeliales bacterium]|nr:hypothetical protein [Candidatus Babeliales bacterium]
WPHAKNVSTIFEEYYRLNIPIQNRPKKLLVHTERPSMVEPLTLPKKPGSSTPRRKKSVIKKITD